MSNTVTLINNTLSSKQALEYQCGYLKAAIAKMSGQLSADQTSVSSIVLCGTGDKIWVSNKDAIVFASAILSSKQSELDKVNLKLSAIGSLLGVQ